MLTADCWFSGKSPFPPRILIVSATASLFPAGRETMKTFFVGLALGFGIGFLLLPRSGNEHDDLIRERTRELQRALPSNHQRELRNASVAARDRYSRSRRPAYVGA